MKSCAQLHSAHSCLPGILTFFWTLAPLGTHQSPYPPGQATWHEDTCNLSVFLFITPPNSDHRGTVCTKSILRLREAHTSYALTRQVYLTLSCLYITQFPDLHLNSQTEPGPAWWAQFTHFLTSRSSQEAHPRYHSSVLGLIWK